jgi:hypothetical protein
VCLEYSPKLFLNLRIVVECKATTKPWVILKDSIEAQWHNPLVDFSGEHGGFINNNLPDDAILHLRDVYRLQREQIPLRPSAGYAIIEAFKDANDRDAVYVATRQLVSAIEHEASHMYTEDEIGYASLLPVLVTASPLFEAALDPDSGKLVTRQTTYSAVNLRSNTRDRTFVAVILKDDELTRFCQSIAPLTDTLPMFLNEFELKSVPID